MQTVVPFRAWRYDTQKAGDLGSLIAPPYDVVDPALQSRLYARSLHNVIRIDLGMTTPSDSACDNRYTRAASQLADWKANGVVTRDQEPSVTFIEETFTGPDGRRSVRHGFLALIKLSEFGEGVVFPHERTLSGPKEDRFRLMEATRMSLSPVFLLYDLPGDEITKAWRSGPGKSQPHATLTDPDAHGEATQTRLWPVSEQPVLQVIEQALAGGRFIIADGHHRYETALRYREHRREESASTSTQPAAPDYALAYFSNMADPGLAIYGTHRLLSGLDEDAVSALRDLLSPTFTVDRLTDGENADEAREAITAYLAVHPRRAFGLWGRTLAGAYGFQVADERAVATSVPQGSEAYRNLDVSILQSLVFERILGISADDMASEKYVTYFKDTGDAFDRLASAEFQAGFFMNPTGLDQIRDVAFGGERMPQKATFFYPKLPTGLVFYDLAGLW